MLLEVLSAIKTCEETTEPQLNALGCLDESGKHPKDTISRDGQGCQHDSLALHTSECQI